MSRRWAGVAAEISSAIGVPASGKWIRRRASMRPGNSSRLRRAPGSVSDASTLPSASCSKTLHITRRVHFEVSFEPHGVVPPSDSYTGTMRPISSMANSASGPVTPGPGRISNCGWIILKRPAVEREASSLP